MTRGRLYVYDALLARPAYNFKHMAFECSLLVSAPKPIMGQGRRFRGRFPERKGHVLEIPPQPSEEGVVTITRVLAAIILIPRSTVLKAVFTRA
jgi:hypothetical protein